MATLTISLSGSSVVNGTKTYTVTDADIQNLINWATFEFATKPDPINNPNPPALTPQQALLAWVQWWIIRSQLEVQRFGLQTTVPPAPVFA